MADRIRFHLDEQVDPDIARALRQYGIDVTTTVEVGLRTATDVAQFEFARRDGRTLVTHDTDFLRMAATSGAHAGLAYCDRTSRTLGEIIRSLILLYEVLAPEEIAGRVEYL